MEPHYSPNSKDKIAATLGKGGLCVCRERKIEEDTAELRETRRIARRHRRKQRECENCAYNSNKSFNIKSQKTPHIPAILKTQPYKSTLSRTKHRLF